jgi:hypothetical protein
MPNRPPARAGTAWTIRSVPTRSRDGAERLDRAYRRLLDDPPPLSTPQPEVSPPCAPPSTPALFNRSLDVKAWLATSLEA